MLLHPDSGKKNFDKKFLLYKTNVCENIRHLFTKSLYIVLSLYFVFTATKFNFDLLFHKRNNFKNAYSYAIYSFIEFYFFQKLKVCVYFIISPGLITG